MNLVLYSTNCPQCKVLQSKLDQAGFEYKLVEDQDVMIKKGFMSAPILEVDGAFLNFSKAIQWIKEMTE